MSSPKRLRIRPRGWLVLVPLTVILFLVYRWLGVMSVESLVFMNAGCQFLLIVLGVAVAVKPDIGVKHPWVVIGAFVLLGGAGMVAAIRQQQIAAKETAEAQRQAAEANTKLSNSLDNLNRGAEEISRVQKLNTELQQKLLESSGQILNQGETISGLSRQAIETTTGGESFCHMSLMGDPNGLAMTPVFSHVGKNPLYEVQARIVNFQLVDPLAQRKPLPINEIMATDRSISLGELIPESAWVDHEQGVPFNTAKTDRQDYRVFFTARNGYWEQDLIWQKTNKGWAEATRVFRREGTKRRLVFTKIDKRFPERKIKWHS